MKIKVSPLRLIVNILITLAAAAVYYYIELPPINPHSGSFWWFIALIIIVFTALMLFAGRGSSAQPTRPVDALLLLWEKVKIPVIALGVIAVICIVGQISSAVFFNVRAYSNLIDVEDGDFTEDVAEISYDQIPMLDEISANTLANRKLGELSDLVSQFEVDDSSAQINVNGAPVRVSYLNYGGFFKWLNNRNEGIPAYITIDMVTQEVSVERLSEGMKYTPSEPFNRNIMRHLRFLYPTLLFTDVNFEIDDSGTPYWVASVISKKIGLFGGEDVTGAVLVNGITGEAQYYDIADVPTWVDRAYTASLIINQYDYHGKYQNGFWNSIFGQSGCTITTSGYNYIAADDDVWVYTGITSVGGDESNVGFILVNQRTKEANYYNVAGAEEYSAMSSAEGAVQQYSYNATFPLLLNIEGQPTYFMALKDASNLVKMYAMVNVQQYQIVANGYSLSECEENYYELLKKNSIITGETEAPVVEAETKDVSGTITEIRQAVTDGTTYYYVKLDGDVYYRLSSSDSESAVLLDVGDGVHLTYEVSDEDRVIIPAKIG